MMGSKVFKAFTAVAAAAAAAWLLPKRKKKMAVRPVPAGESMSCIRERTGVNEDALCLYYYRPGRWTEKDAVFIAFHGFGRDGAEYCKALRKLAEERNMLIVCPELTERKYPGAEWYQEGGIMDADGHIREKEERTFSAADRIVAEVKNRTQAAGKIILFGHSAGGQFVHRWALLGGKKNVDVIAVANSGWFTMPDRDIDYPYGIKNVGITDEELGEAFAEPVILFMGEKDVERKPPFRDTPEADAQGMNRMERCTNYFRQCKAKAEELRVPFRWKLETVEGAAHQGVKMAEGAAAYIFRKSSENGNRRV